MSPFRTHEYGEKRSSARGLCPSKGAIRRSYRPRVSTVYISIPTHRHYAVTVHFLKRAENVRKNQSVFAFGTNFRRTPRRCFSLFPNLYSKSFSTGNTATCGGPGRNGSPAYANIFFRFLLVDERLQSVFRTVFIDSIRFSKKTRFPRPTPSFVVQQFVMIYS